jgi:hypothetical protein
MPKAWFKPVGQAFINGYNQRFNGQLGPEWAGRTKANIIYYCVVSMYNFSHPGFNKTAPAQLQVMHPVIQMSPNISRLISCNPRLLR